MEFRAGDKVFLSDAALERWKISHKTRSAPEPPFEVEQDSDHVVHLQEFTEAHCRWPFYVSELGLWGPEEVVP